MLKPQATLDHFNPAARSPRNQQTERAYRKLMHKQLMVLLEIMNPQDRIHYGAMSYEDLVVYTRDWLKTEADAIAGNPVDVSAGRSVNPHVDLSVDESPPGLSLD